MRSEPVANDRTSGEVPRSGYPGLRCGPYVLTKLIDIGGFSEVWEAAHTLVNQPAAIKLLRLSRQQDRDARDRFHREVMILSKIDHINVVSFREADFVRGDHGEELLWLAMERLDGATLRARLNQGQTFDEEEALRIAFEITCGVAQAHELRVVHRDIKPENVFLTSKRVAKVLDFGIAKFNGWGFKSTGRNSLSLGTPSYMSPEMVLSEPPGYASDVYQIGLVLYEMLSGRYPFGYLDGEMPTASQIAEMQARHMPAPLTEMGIAPEVWALVEKALQKRPEDRWPSAEAFAQALWELLLDVRKTRAHLGMPSDEVNPDSSSGTPLGPEARRAYAPAAVAQIAEPTPHSPRARVAIHPHASPSEPPRSEPSRKRWERTEPVRNAPVDASDPGRTTMPMPPSKRVDDRIPGWVAKPQPNEIKKAPPRALQLPKRKSGSRTRKGALIGVVVGVAAIAVVMGLMRAREHKAPAPVASVNEAPPIEAPAADPTPNVIAKAPEVSSAPIAAPAPSASEGKHKPSAGPVSTGKPTVLAPKAAVTPAVSAEPPRKRIFGSDREEEP